MDPIFEVSEKTHIDLNWQGIAKDLYNINCWIMTSIYSHKTNQGHVIPFKDNSLIIYQTDSYHEYDVIAHSRKVGSLLSHYLTQNLPYTSEPQYMRIFHIDEDFITKLQNLNPSTVETKLRKEIHRLAIRLSQDLNFDSQTKQVLIAWGYIHDMCKLLDSDILISTEKTNVPVRVNNPFHKELSSVNLGLDIPRYEILVLDYFAHLGRQQILSQNEVKFLGQIHTNYTFKSTYIKDYSDLAELNEEGNDKASTLLLVADELAKGFYFPKSNELDMDSRVHKLEKLLYLLNL